MGFLEVKTLLFSSIRHVVSSLGERFLQTFTLYRKAIVRMIRKSRRVLRLQMRAARVVEWGSGATWLMDSPLTAL